MSGDKVNEQKEPAVKFLDYMCAQDCAFSTVEKQLGKFVAVLFYLREFEKFLKKSPQGIVDGVPEQANNISVMQSPDDCGNCSHKFSCKWSPFGKPMVGCEHWQCCYSDPATAQH